MHTQIQLDIYLFNFLFFVFYFVFLLFYLANIVTDIHTSKSLPQTLNTMHRAAD